MVQDQCLIPTLVLNPAQPSTERAHLHADLLVDALLLVLDLLFDLLERCGVRSGAICFEDLNIPAFVNEGL